MEASWESGIEKTSDLVDPRLERDREERDTRSPKEPNLENHGGSGDETSWAPATLIHARSMEVNTTSGTLYRRRKKTKEK